MKIVFVTETFLPATDGIVTRLLHGIDYLTKHGHEVIVYAPNLEGTPSHYNGAQIKTFHAQTFSFYKERPWAIPSLSIYHHLKQDQPDVVHAFNPFSLAASGAFFADKLNIPLVSSFHTNIPQYLELYGYPNKMVELTWSYIRHWHNISLVNMVPSFAMHELLLEKDVADAIVLPKGIDLDARNPKHANPALRERLKADKSRDKLLLFVGRLAAEKEVESLRPLLESRSDINLAIVGDGPDRKRLEKHFEGLPVTFTGFLHGEELSQAFASADAFVFPSISETLGQVILEAMASGLPVIAAKSGPINEQITHGKNGYLYEQQDITELSSLIDLLADEMKRKKVIQNGLNYANQFSWDNTTQTMLDAYKQAIEMKESEMREMENKQKALWWI